MEPFSITCTTCQARLRVRDPSSIGQILTCPKCGSMVLIQAASDGSNVDPATGSSVTDSVAAKPPPRPGLHSTAENTLPLAVGKLDEATLDRSSEQANDFADTVEDLTQYGTKVSESLGGESVPLPPELPKKIPGGSRHEERQLPTRDSDNATAAPTLQDSRGRWLVPAMSGGAGVLLAFGVFLWIARGSAVPNPASSAALRPLAANASSAPEVLAESQEVPAAEPSAEDPLVASDPAPVPGELLSSPSEPIPPATTPPPTSTAPTTQEPPIQPKAKPPLAFVQDQPPPSGETPRVDTSRAKPPLSVPPGFSSPPMETEPADRLSGTGSLADTLRRLGGMFDSSAPASEPESRAEPKDPEFVEPESKPDMGPPRLPRPAPRSVDVAARLDDPIPAIEFPGTPLHEFLQFVANYSTIPISLDPDMLMWQGITPTTPVTVKRYETTVTHLLDDVLGKFGLVRQTVDEQLWITRASTNTDDRRSVRLNVSDLVQGDAAQTQALVEHVTKLIEPGTWNGTVDGGSISQDGIAVVVKHTDEVLFQVITLCEKLRIARGLPVRSKFDPSCFQLATRADRARRVLEKPLSINFPHPTTFVKILSRISQETGVLPLVDWRAVAEIGWNPDAEVTFTASNQPCGEALQALLASMELTYRVVDGTTIQITTPHAAENHLELEFYRLPESMKPLKDPELPPRQILDLVPTEWLRAGGGSGRIRCDMESNCLLVMLPPPRQKAFEQLLRNATKLAEKQTK